MFKEILEKNESLILIVFKTLIVFSFFVFCFYFFSSPKGSGDELLFLNDLNFLNDNGWYQAISKKIGLSYLILVYPFTFFFENYIALRIVNVLLFGLLSFYLLKYGKIKNPIFYFLFLFYSSNGWFILGTNDCLFIVCLVIFFNEVYNFLQSKSQTNNSLMYLSLIIALFTRELFYAYVPAILISFYFLFKNNFNFSSNLKIPLLILVLMIAINIPSIIANHKFSYDNKLPPNQVKSSWSQRQYLTQLMLNDGSLANGNHATWQETDNFLLKNGSQSLPNSVQESITFDFKLTMKEFFKNLFTVFFQSIRQTGLIIITMSLFLLFGFFKKKFIFDLYIPFIAFLMIGIFSFIVISYVESRWLTPIFIMSLISFANLEIKNSLPKTAFILNQLTIILVLFYGLYKVYIKI